MKKIFIFALLICSLLLVGCESSENNKKDESIKIDTNIKKTKYKKLICSFSGFGNDYTITINNATNYNENDEADTFSLTFGIEISKDIFNKLTDAQKKQVIENAKTTFINPLIEDYVGYDYNYTTSTRDNYTEAEIKITDRSELEALDNIENTKNDLEEAGYYCFIQESEF